MQRAKQQSEARLLRKLEVCSEHASDSTCFNKARKMKIQFNCSTYNKQPAVHPSKKRLDL
jgi:hypothetical protein